MEKPDKQNTRKQATILHHDHEYTIFDHCKDLVQTQNNLVFATQRAIEIYSEKIFFSLS